MTIRIVNNLPVPKRGQRAVLWYELLNPYWPLDVVLVELSDAVFSGTQPEDGDENDLWSLVGDCDEFTRCYRTYDPNEEVLVVFGGGEDWTFWTVDRPGRVRGRSAASYSAGRRTCRQNCA
jgi:hypothetical protein